MKITNDIVEKHGLNLDEFSKIKKILKRDPNLLELGIFSVNGCELPNVFSILIM